MEFHEKLQRRVAQLGLNKSKASRDAGLPDSTISAYLAKAESLPRIDIALKIAKAIQVPLEWLADDKADWPPPDPAPKNRATILSDVELVTELAIRLRRVHIWLLESLEKAHKVDWLAVQKGVENFRESEDNFTPEMEAALDAVRQIELAYGYWSMLIPSVTAWQVHDSMPGSNRPREDFDPLMMLAQILAIESSPGYRELRRKIFSDPPAKILADLERSQKKQAFIERIKGVVAAAKSLPPTLRLMVQNTAAEQLAVQDIEKLTEEHPEIASKPLKKASKKH